MYAGGSFTTAGGKTCNKIARWDGDEWFTLGTGLDNSCLALNFDNLSNILYVGGDFTNRIAVWNTIDSRWENTTISLNNRVSSMINDDFGNIYVTGNFTSVNDDYTLTTKINKVCSKIVKIIKREIPINFYIDETLIKKNETNNFMTVFKNKNGKLFHDESSEISIDNIMLSKYEVDTSLNLYISLKNNSINYVCNDHEIMHSVYNFDCVELPLIANFNACIYSLKFNLDHSKLYIGGEDFTVDSSKFIAMWDGNTLFPLGTGLSDVCLTLECDNYGNVYAGGHFTIAGGVSCNRIAKWNGTTWSPLGTGLNGICESLKFGPDGNLYAGGHFTTAGGKTCNRIARWDGNEWFSLGTGLSGGCHALDFDNAGNLYAGGRFITAGDKTCNGIARWDSNEWFPLGTGLSSMAYDKYCFCLKCSNNGNFTYIGGNFVTVGGKTCNGIARWDGNEWSSLRNGFSSLTTVFCRQLELDNNENLYAVGSFTRAGNVLSNGIAKFDGLNWSSFNQSFSTNWRYGIPYVTALAVNGNDIYIGTAKSANHDRFKFLYVNPYLYLGYLTPKIPLSFAKISKLNHINLFVDNLFLKQIKNNELIKIFKDKNGRIFIDN